MFTTKNANSAKPFFLFALFAFFAVNLSFAATTPFQREVYLMGTTLRIDLYQPDRVKAAEQTEKIIRVIEATEDQLSTWRETSELSQINNTPVGSPFPMSGSLCALMLSLQDSVKQTGGAFDPAIGRLLEVWGIHHQIRIPSDAELREARNVTGFGFYKIDPKECTVSKIMDIRIDAGAFGKGAALDRVRDMAVKEDLPAYLIDFGGQLAVWKTPPNGSTWLSSMADPTNREKTTTMPVRFPSGSLSTSGQSVQQVKVGDRMIGHILDPLTGNPVPAFGSVTVWSESALQADILSTALFVMGPKDGLLWATNHHIAACFLTPQKAYPTRDFLNLPK